MEKVTLSLCLLIVLIGAIGGIDSHRQTCRYTPTVVKGLMAPTGPICAGQLLLDERFTELDRNFWKHEITLGGGGVSEIVLFSSSTVCYFFISLYFFLLHRIFFYTRYNLELGISMVC